MAQNVTSGLYNREFTRSALEELKAALEKMLHKTKSHHLFPRLVMVHLQSFQFQG